MLLFAAAGVMGGLLRDLAPEKEFIWKFTPFPDLAIVRLLRRGDLRLAGFSIACVGVIVLAEVLRSHTGLGIPQPWRVRAARINWQDAGPWILVAVYATTLFSVALPIKIWNSNLNEKRLEQQQLRLNEARLAALSSQINPHFLFNTLNSVASLIRLDPDQARQVVYKLSKILRRLLRQQDNLTTLRRRTELYRRLPGDRNGPVRRQAALRQGNRSGYAWTCWSPACCSSRWWKTAFATVWRAKWMAGPSGCAAAASGTSCRSWSKTTASAFPKSRLARMFEQGGIGVTNVNERLKVLYGDSYRMWIDSRPGEGTSTGIEIPEQVSGTVVGVESLVGSSDG